MKEGRIRRNCMVFEAPKELTDKARIYANKKMVSTSAVCRQALNQFLIEEQVVSSIPKFQP